MLEYCVTGGTGFIASELVRALLAEGHAVRATVRDPADEAKVGFLRSFDGAKERLRLVKADLVVEGSFDEAVDGADGVFHTACPVYAPPGQNIQEALIDPAIRGTANVLKSCSKASSVRRVVLTSTCAAVRCGDYQGENPHSMDTTKIEDLGMPPFKAIPQMFDDFIKNLQEKGFL
ncbi:putative anthocyanidin reductase [Cocos nucifera]|uniref:Putative anthocyanidin reductase n=1 Tax=Cocos nucifera TaxID=13894 RepID=A0A8K0HYG9_COCNU|nr:putative anthocyanidin reductase [Cocos nucifera]